MVWVDLNRLNSIKMVSGSCLFQILSGKFYLNLMGTKEFGELVVVKRIIDLAIMSTPTDLNRVLMLTQELEKKKDYKKLSVIYDGMLKKYPENPILLNAYAWMLAAAEDKKYRNYEKAVKLAGQAVKLTDEANGAILDTLAVQKVI